MSNVNTIDPTHIRLGQRWLSEADGSLGLGAVVAYDQRTVTLEFSCCHETRTYAIGTAPLTRAVFAVNDHLEDVRGRHFTVTQVHDIDGILGYSVENEHGESSQLHEADLSPRMRINRPRERLLNGRPQKDLWFRLRYRTWQRHAQRQRSDTLGLAGPRIQLIPHQLYVASQVAARALPRVLLSDEVGLGKTIEAGLILHRLLLSGRASRALILVPDNLLHQWLVELLRRFNLKVALFNAARFSEFDAQPDNDRNPFDTEQLALTSLPLLLADATRARAVLDAHWDVLVVDEAHHLTWTPETTGLEYDLVAALANQIPSLLLLTATPEQLGQSGHFGRLHLLDPERFHDYAAFVEEQRAFSDIAEIGRKLADDIALTQSEHSHLQHLLGADTALATPAERRQALHHLVDRHGTGRVLFRNTRAAITGFAGRQLHTYPLTPPTQYEGSPDPCPEQALGESWVSLDGRCEWLFHTVMRLRPDKVLVICASAATALDLRHYLANTRGLPAGVFHEGMSIVERDRAAAYFAESDDGAQCLICSEIGSEGRNFQFAHHLVLFDLPTEPDLLEQRIGRLDRIGQRHDIDIHVPYFRGLASEFLLHWYRDALGAFTRTCVAGQPVRDQLGPALTQALADAGRRDALLAQSRAAREALEVELAQGRDRLLELHSHRPDVSDKLCRRLRALDESRELDGYMSDFWDAFGVEAEPGPNRTTVLHPGNHMLQDRFPALPEDGLTLTFERELALQREDYAFLTWEHPMTQGAMELLMSSDLGNTAFVVVQARTMKPGTLLLELLYVAEALAPKSLAIGRFLPPSPIRLLLDAGGRDHAARLSHDAIRGECLTRDRRTAAALIQGHKARLTKLFAIGDRLAQTQGHALAAAARQAADDDTAAELARLKALAAVNPSVRADEVDWLTTQRERLLHHLSDTHVRLDAARVIMTH